MNEGDTFQDSKILPQVLYFSFCVLAENFVATGKKEVVEGFNLRVNLLVFNQLNMIVKVRS